LWFLYFSPILCLLSVVWFYFDPQVNLALVLACTTLHLPAVRVTMNEPTAFADVQVTGVRAHLNQAYGLRADSRPFCTSFASVDAIDCDVNLWKSTSFFTFVQGWKIKWQEAMTEVDAAIASMDLHHGDDNNDATPAATTAASADAGKAGDEWTNRETGDGDDESPRDPSHHRYRTFTSSRDFMGTQVSGYLTKQDLQRTSCYVCMHVRM
jgi:hypothetical protein